MVALTADGGPLHVLDLPQLYTRPSYDELMAVLDSLTVQPPTWEAEHQTVAPRRRVVDDRNNGVAAYLSRIVSSSLAWLATDDQREDIWEAASRRLSERSGRFGMPAMTRTWRIPASARNDTFDVVLHEPPLTADNVGFKTWASSFLLAQNLAAIGTGHLARLLGAPDKPHVLELGAGTGLVGMAAAVVWQTPVVLTDLPQILTNLQLNVDKNQELLEARGANVSVDVLDWADPQPLSEGHFEIIVAADVIYSVEHASLLVPVIRKFLAPSSHARVVVEIPLRDKATHLMKYEFTDLMSSSGFALAGEGLQTGFDDWEVNGARAEVQCWWGVWQRHENI